MYHAQMETRYEAARLEHAERIRTSERLRQAAEMRTGHRQPTASRERRFPFVRTIFSRPSEA